MKKAILALGILAASSMAFAGEAPASKEEIAKQEQEVKCIADGVKLRQALDSGSGSFLNGYVNLLPSYREKLEMDLADPYRCSLAGRR